MGTWRNVSRILVLSLMLSVATAGVGGAPAVADVPAPHPAALLEIRFMKGMIDHHHMAVMMAEMCLDKAVHPELEASCEMMLVMQSQEIALMQNWLLEWYGITYEPTMGQMPPGHMRQMEKLAGLSGTDFEVAFMTEMIHHHRQAVREAQVILRQGYHPELLATAEMIISTQTTEITQMEDWLCAWYDICRGPR